MEEIYKALGWQGGTIHQILAEIKRLKQVDINCNDCKAQLIYKSDEEIDALSREYAYAHGGGDLGLVFKAHKAGMKAMLKSDN